MGADHHVFVRRGGLLFSSEILLVDSRRLRYDLPLKVRFFLALSAVRVMDPLTDASRALPGVACRNKKQINSAGSIFSSVAPAFLHTYINYKYK